MKFAGAITGERSTEQAAREVIEQARSALGGADVDLALVFVSHHHRPSFAKLSALVREALAPAHFLGCTGEGVIGSDRELERQPALALWAAHLPGVQIQSFHLTFEQTKDGGFFSGWPKEMPSREQAPVFLLLPEPFSVPGDVLLEQLNDDYPEQPVIGGMASGAMGPGQNCLFLNDQVLNEGVVAAVLHGNIQLKTVVSQGCRPIGKHFVVTKAQGNIIHTLGGKPALAQLQEVFQGLSAEEKTLASQALHLGRVINEYKSTFERGDFLVRNLMGADQQSGAIAVADAFRAGQTVQFHVRDAGSAREDLRELLRQTQSAGGASGAGGALLFSCNGRGQRLFGEANQDVGALRETIGAIPVAGFFAQGEIGPVGGKNFLHGFTASVGLFLPKEAK